MGPARDLEGSLSPRRQDALCRKTYGPQPRLRLKFCLALTVLAKTAHQFAHLLNALRRVEAEGSLRLQRRAPVKFIINRCMVAMSGGNRVAPKTVFVWEPVRRFRLGAAFKGAQLFDELVKRCLASAAPAGERAFAFAASRKLVGSE